MKTKNYSTQLIVDAEKTVLYAFRGSPRFQEKGKESYLLWTLIPIAIYDYVDPDYSDVQGWLQDLNVIDGNSIEDEVIVQYVLTESFEEAMAQFGYSFIDIHTVYVKEYHAERAVPSSADTAVANAKDLW